MKICNYETKSSIIKAVDSILTIHRNDKGIIHTTSYQQLRFIKDNISGDNSQRLLVTDPNIRREEVIAEHKSTILHLMDFLKILFLRVA